HGRHCGRGSAGGGESRAPFARGLRVEPVSGEQRRVVVTGLGAVTPLGADLATSWGRLLAGENGAGPLTAFPEEGQPVRIACEASEFAPERWLEREALERLDRV